MTASRDNRTLWRTPKVRLGMRGQVIARGSIRAAIGQFVPGGGTETSKE